MATGARCRASTQKSITCGSGRHFCFVGADIRSTELCTEEKAVADSEAALRMGSLGSRRNPGRGRDSAPAPVSHMGSGGPAGGTHMQRLLGRVAELMQQLCDTCMHSVTAFWTSRVDVHVYDRTATLWLSCYTQYSTTIYTLPEQSGCLVNMQVAAGNCNLANCWSLGNRDIVSSVTVQSALMVLLAARQKLRCQYLTQNCCLSDYRSDLKEGRF